MNKKLRINGIHLGLFLKNTVKDGLLKNIFHQSYLEKFLHKLTVTSEGGVDLNEVRYDSQENIAASMLCSVSSVYRAEKYLVEIGILDKENTQHPNDIFRQIRKLTLSEKSKNKLVKIASHFENKPKKPNDFPSSQREGLQPVPRTSELNQIGQSNTDQSCTNIDPPKPKRKRGSSAATQIVSTFRKVNSNFVPYIDYIDKIDELIALAGGGNAGYKRVASDVSGISFKDFDHVFTGYRASLMNNDNPIREEDSDSDWWLNHGQFQTMEFDMARTNG